MMERCVEIPRPDGAADGFLYRLYEREHPGVIFLPFLPSKPYFKDDRIAARFRELTSTLPPDAMRRDGSAYVDFLAAQPGVSKGPMGIAGFCFTGQFALRVAAARADRIGVAASFHGGGLFKDDPASPHLELPRVKARL